jgi:valyl-tRNA synthetase
MKNEQCSLQRGIIVSASAPAVCPYCGSSDLVQDEDVLDTWFSSGLWPFSTLGWPDSTNDLKAFYPTSVLVTGFDIIFFWVARMIMMGCRFMNDVPFRDVYIHALVRDIHGQKMSKSKGNVVDPLIMMERYGTDAFRFTLAAFAAQGRDVRFSEERVEGYRHFVNKLWNASRFIMMNLETLTPEELTDIREKDKHANDLASRWIMSRLDATVEQVNKALEDYRFNDAAGSIYQFIWHEFCDWYIEMAKSGIEDPEARKGVFKCLLYSLDTALRLLHPFMPYVTEEIWQTVRGQAAADNESDNTESIMVSEFPKPLQRDFAAEDEMSYVIDVVTGIRTIRGELNIAPSVKLNASVKTFIIKTGEILLTNIHYIKRLAKAGNIEIGINIEKSAGSATSVKSALEVYVPLKGVLNIETEINRLNKDMHGVNESLIMINRKLMNEDFLERAPQEIVKKEKAKFDELSGRKERIAESIKRLKEAGGEA